MTVYESRVQATLQAEARLKSKLPKDPDQTLITDQTPPDQLQTIATEQFGIDYEQAVQTLNQSPYKGVLSIGQYFSFLQTQQSADRNPALRTDPYGLRTLPSTPKNFKKHQKKHFF